MLNYNSRVKLKAKNAAPSRAAFLLARLFRDLLTEISQDRSLSGDLLMTKPIVKIKHPKRRGEWAEMRFMAMATENGIEVSKPYGETAHYDFAVEHDGKFARVQVKSTYAKQGRSGYACALRGGMGPYGPNDFDFVAIYVIPEDLWYIIPTKNLRGRYTLGLYPNLKNARYERYREAWHLLRGESATSGRVRSIKACAEELAIPSFPVPGPHDEGPHILLAGM